MPPKLDCPNPHCTTRHPFVLYHDQTKLEREHDVESRTNLRDVTERDPG